MFIVYLLFYSALFYYLLFCSVLFCSILFCKDINKTQSAPRFFPKRAWGNLYYYRFHLFFTFFRYPALPSFTHDKSLYYAICYPLLCHLLPFVMLYNVLYRSLSVLSPSIVSQKLLYK